MNRKYLLIGVFCLIVCLCCVMAALYPKEAKDPVAESMTISSAPQLEIPAPSPEISAPPYESPIDFENLQAENPDICAWLLIEDSEVSYPILQSTEDDSFYINHDSTRQYSAAGALFTESSYNSANFSDPVTIIYGHRMNSGSFFGGLQKMYSDSDGFEKHRRITIYLPNKEQHYIVFAAIPYDNRHILYHYNFESKRMYNSFLDSVYSVRAIGANIAEDVDITTYDHLLILSTCLMGDRSMRYLVLARLDEVVET